MLATALMQPASAPAADCSNVGSDPTAAQYCPPSGDNEVEGVSTQGGPPPSSPPPAPPTGDVAGAAASNGSLPFTGLDLGVLALVASALTGAGLLLRRFAAQG